MPDKEIADQSISGDDEEQAQADRAGFKTTVVMVTGGETKDIMDGGTEQVGNPYSLDPLGETKGG